MTNYRLNVLPNRHLHDLNPLFCGEEKCASGHTFGPAVRDCVLIHFIVSGSGTYTLNGITYSVCAGQAFIILPDRVTVYSADDKDPWHYKWIAFDGALSSKFSELAPVIRFTTNWADEILSLDRDAAMLEYAAASKLFLMYTEFFAKREEKNDYIKAVKDYVKAKYIQHISVEEISDRLSLDRRYLSRIFKQKTGKSIQEYIIWTRMEKAKKLLEQGSPVAQAAQLCGYDDVCNFSKMFKKQTGISPTLWKSLSLSHHQ